MALPDVDDTDEIDRMMLDDINGKKFKNVGLRVSECSFPKKKNIVFADNFSSFSD